MRFPVDKAKDKSVKLKLKILHRVKFTTATVVRDSLVKSLQTQRCRGSKKASKKGAPTAVQLNITSFFLLNL